MTDPEIYELLDEPSEDIELPPGLPPLTEDARALFDHLLIASGLLMASEEAYEEPLGRIDSGDDPPADIAVELAGAMAAVVQSALRHPERLASVPEQDWRPIMVFMGLQDVLCSTFLLSTPDTRDQAWSLEAIKRVIGQPIVQELRELLDEADGDSG